MALNTLRKGASGGLGKVILFGFMAMAVGGLVMMDVGGFFRGGISNSDVARAGEEKISIVSFDRTLRRTLQRLGISVQDAYRMGYVEQLLNSEVRGALLHQAAAKTGIIIKDERVAKQVRQLIQPAMRPGQDPKEALMQILRSQGIGEQEFVRSIEREMAGSLLTNALTSNAEFTPAMVLNDMYAYQNEKRDLEYIVYLDSEVTDLPEPEEEELRALYDATKEAYANLERRSFEVIRIKDDALRKTLEISDEEIKDTYESNIDLYHTPATRTLAQAVLTSEEEAQKVAAIAKKGTGLEKAVKEVTGQGAAFLGVQSFVDEDLPEHYKDEVLAADKKGAVIGPVQSPLGWYVVTLDKITPEKTRTLAEVSNEIRDELLDTRFVDQLYALSNTLDDMMAAGSSIQEAAQEIDLEITELPAMNSFGLDENNKDAFAKKPDYRKLVLESGFELLEDETSPVMETDEGDFVAVHVKSITPKSYPPFEEVKKTVKEKLVADQKRMATKSRAAAALAAIEAEGQSFADFAKASGKTLKTAKSLQRMDELKAPLSTQTLGLIFEMPQGPGFLIDVEGGKALARISDIRLPEKVDAKSDSYVNLEKNLEQNNRNEAMVVYLEQARKELGAGINRKLLERVYGQGTASY